MDWDLGQSATGLVEEFLGVGILLEMVMIDKNRYLDTCTQVGLSGVVAVGGFYDPNAIYPKYKDEPDTNRFAVNNEDKEHLSLTLRKDPTSITGVSTTDFDPFTNPDEIVLSQVHVE